MSDTAERFGAAPKQGAKATQVFRALRRHD